MTTIYDFQAELLEGEQKNLGRLSGQGFIGGEYGKPMWLNPTI